MFSTEAFFNGFFWGRAVPALASLRAGRYVSRLASRSAPPLAGLGLRPTASHRYRIKKGLRSLKHEQRPF